MYLLHVISSPAVIINAIRIYRGTPESATESLCVCVHVVVIAETNCSVGHADSYTFATQAWMRFWNGIAAGYIVVVATLRAGGRRLFNCGLPSPERNEFRCCLGAGVVDA